jgi:2-dehydropantoate 2-reductase
LRDGLPVDMLDLRKGRKRHFHGVYKLAAKESVSPADGFELVIVPVKHYALAKTLEEVVPAAGRAEFLLLTQNWHGTAEIDPILPRTRYIYGDAKAGGSFSAGILVAALKAIDIGPPEGELSTLAANVAAIFRSAAIPANLRSDMLHYLWVQYAITGGPWAALVQAGSFEALLSDRKTGPAALAAAPECLEVVRRRGVDLASYPEAKPFLGNSVLSRQALGWTMKWMFRHNEYVKRCSPTRWVIRSRLQRSTTISSRPDMILALLCRRWRVTPEPSGVSRLLAAQARECPATPRSNEKPRREWTPNQTRRDRHP